MAVPPNGVLHKEPWLPYAVLFASAVVPLAIVVWKDFTTDPEEELPPTVPRMRLLVAAALVVYATVFMPFWSSFGWLFQAVSLVGTAWIIAPLVYRRWFIIATLLFTFLGRGVAQQTVAKVVGLSRAPGRVIGSTPALRYREPGGGVADSGAAR